MLGKDFFADSDVIFLVGILVGDTTVAGRDVTSALLEFDLFVVV